MKKYLHIEVKDLPEGIKDLYQAESYPEPGLYRDKDGYLRVVTAKEVTTIIYGLPDGHVINENPGAGQGIGEELLLKAIAAASRAEVLK